MAPMSSSSTPEFLKTILSPADVKGLPEDALPTLAEEIRQRMISVVSKTGGHIAPSLGTVELTLALCRVFDFPHDKLIWDVGHQAYAWKMLSGRNEAMEKLRCYQGIKGFPFPAESPYDAFVGGHAGVALSAALGMAAARDLHHEERNIIAVVGDASLTNGISLEAINAIRNTTNRLILIINDNGMSISKNVGAFSRMLARRLSGVRYNRIRAAAEMAGHKLRLGWLRKGYRNLKRALKSLLLKQRAALFEDLGLRYMGPIDGHDISALVNALQSAAESTEPIALHIATVKGKGFQPAERTPSKWHGVSPWAVPQTPTALPSWSEAFGDALVNLAKDNPSIVAITAAMRDGTGLAPFFTTYPERAYDVGICEAHAVAFAAGLAAAGQRPYVALYSSFAQRAVDNVMHELCLQSLPVTLCLDRAGFVGADGPTHHGLFDIAMLRALPNLTFFAPCCQKDLQTFLTRASTATGPVVIRYPRGNAIETLPAGFHETPETLPTQQGPVLLALGTTVSWMADALDQCPLPILAVREIKPLPSWLTQLQGRPLVTLEDAAAQGGFGAAVSEVHNAPVLRLGWPDTFIGQGSDTELRKEHHLDAPAILQRISAWSQSL